MNRSKLHKTTVAMKIGTEWKRKGETDKLTDRGGGRKGGGDEETQREGWKRVCERGGERRRDRLTDRQTGRDRDTDRKTASGKDRNRYGQTGRQAGRQANSRQEDNEPNRKIRWQAGRRTRPIK